MMMTLVEKLRNFANRDTVMSEFDPDDHIAGMAANRITELETLLLRVQVCEGSHLPAQLMADIKALGKGNE